MELTPLLVILRAHGVLKFKNAEFEIHFESRKMDTAPPEPPAPTIIPAPVPANMPHELANPELMSMDMIRDWSASPDHDPVAPLEGTDDTALAAA